MTSRRARAMVARVIAAAALLSACRGHKPASSDLDWDRDLVPVRKHHYALLRRFQIANIVALVSIVDCHSNVMRARVERVFKGDEPLGPLVDIADHPCNVYDWQKMRGVLFAHSAGEHEMLIPIEYGQPGVVRNANALQAWVLFEDEVDEAQVVATLTELAAGMAATDRNATIHRWLRSDNQHLRAMALGLANPPLDDRPPSTDYGDEYIDDLFHVLAARSSDATVRQGASSWLFSIFGSRSRAPDGSYGLDVAFALRLAEAYIEILEHPTDPREIEQAEVAFSTCVKLVNIARYFEAARPLDLPRRTIDGTSTTTDPQPRHDLGCTDWRESYNDCLVRWYRAHHEIAARNWRAWYEQARARAAAGR